MKLGIQNLDAITKKIEMMEKACQPAVLEKAMEAAGDVLADALAAGTPIGPQSHKTYKRKGERRSAGNARDSVIVVPAKSKQYGVTRTLIGYSKRAYYMLWVIKGHNIVTGGTRGKPGTGRLKRSASGNTHSQSGQGKIVGRVPGHDFMSGIFKSNIKKAMEAARDVIRKAARTGNVGKAA
jgi:hypothetical protein